MLFRMIISGRVINYSGYRNLYVSNENLPLCHYIDDIDFYRNMEQKFMNHYGEYLALYETLVISYCITGNEKIVEFKNVTVSHPYKPGDTIDLIFNKRNQQVQLKE